MRDGWVETTLGEVADVVMGQSPPGTSYNTSGLGLPFVQGSAEFGPRSPMPLKWCSEPRKVARAGELLVSVRAPVGDTNVAEGDLAIGRGLAVVRGKTGVASTEFLGLLLQHAGPELRTRSGGGMFESVTKLGLVGLPLTLPGLIEQRRIVDIVEAIDASLLSGRRVERSAMRALVALLESWLAVNAGTATRLLGDVADMGSGPSWKASDQRDEPLGAMPVLGITNTPIGVELDLSKIGYVVGLPPSTRILSNSSLLMIRTNGNRARIGNIYRVVPEAVGIAYSAFQIGIFPNDPADRDVIYWQLRAPSVQRSISAAASGTTGLGNIAISWLKRLELSWPDEGERARLVEAANALREVRISAKREIERLEELRRGVLADLLSGDHEIPESYDALVEGAVVA